MRSLVAHNFPRKTHLNCNNKFLAIQSCAMTDRKVSLSYNNIALYQPYTSYMYFIYKTFLSKIYIYILVYVVYMYYFIPSCIFYLQISRNVRVAIYNLVYISFVKIFNRVSANYPTQNDSSSTKIIVAWCVN